MAGVLQLISYSGSEPPTVRGDFPKMVQALRVCADKECVDFLDWRFPAVPGGPIGSLQTIDLLEKP